MPISVSLKLMAFIDGDSSPLALAVRILSWMLHGDRVALVRDGVDMVGLRGKGRVGANNIIMQYVEN